MARWEPDAKGRLEKAAMELFRERGYVATTVEEIAARAGLTERTFFRYFTDKREVLFSGSKELEQKIIARILDAPPGMSSLDVVIEAIEAGAGEVLSHRDLDLVQARYALVAEHTDLQERELIKLSALAGAIGAALRGRGVRAPAATLAAETGIAVFRVGFERWISAKKPRDFAGQIRGALAVLRAVVRDEETPPAGRTQARRRRQPA